MSGPSPPPSHSDTDISIINANEGKEHRNGTARTEWSEKWFTNCWKLIFRVIITFLLSFLRLSSHLTFVVIDYFPSKFPFRKPNLFDRLSPHAWLTSHYGLGMKRRVWFLTKSFVYSHRSQTFFWEWTSSYQYFDCFVGNLEASLLVECHDSLKM